MDVLESALKFITAYPAWARALALGGVIVSVLTLVFVPRAQANEMVTLPETAILPEQTSYWLSIDGVDAFGEDNVGIQVTGDVNGTKFVYPSLSGVQWAEVGPTMSSQQFQLPSAPLPFRLRFTAQLRKRGGAPIQLVSQQTILIDRLPTSGRYSLHKRDNEGSRAASISAQVRYTLSARP